MLNEVLAARFLGVAAYGLYALALMLAKTGEIVALFGVPVSVMHFLPVQLNRGERGHVLGTILGCIPMPFAIGVGFALALWLCSDWVAANVLGQLGAAPFLAVLGFAIPLFVVTDLLGNIARAFGRALPYVVIRNLTPQLCVTAVLISLLLWQGPQIGIAYGQLGGLTAGALVGVVFVLSLVRLRVGLVRPAFRIAALYRYAVPVVLNTLASLAIAWTDLFLLGLLTDAATVGIYRGCMQIALAFDLIWNALAAATAPLYTVLIAEDQRDLLRDTYAAAVRLAMLLALPLLLVVIVNGGDILGLLGPAFVAGAPALAVLACGQFAKVAFCPAGIVLSVGGYQKLDASNVAMAAVLNLVLNLALIPLFGIVGAAFSTALALAGLAALRCLQLRRVLWLRTGDRALLRILIATAPVALAIWAVSEALGLGPGSGLLALVLRLAAMAGLIGGSLWLFGLQAEDRAMLRLLLRRGSVKTAPGAVPSPD